MKLDHILTALPTLTAAERNEIRIRLQFWSKRDAPSVAQERFIAEMFELMNGQLAERGVPTMTWKAFCVSSRAPQFKRAVDEVELFMKTFLGNVNRAQRRNALEMIGRLLVLSLQRNNLPIRYATLISRIPSIPALVNRAFPGYCENGIFPWALRVRKQIARAAKAK